MAALDGISLAEIDSRLRERAVELVEHLRGVAPNRSRSDRRTVRFGRKGGLAVDIDGSKKGRIIDFNDGGDKALSPLQFIQAEIGGSFADAIEWAKAWLGIEGDAPARRMAPKPSPAELERQEAEEEAERRAKVEQIVSESRVTNGTPAQAYLWGRGITAELPDVVRWRGKAWGHYGALVLLATDATGGIKAAQQVYVTAEGAKAPLKVQKRSNGSQEGAAVRLPGKAPLTLMEGPEDALSVWQATGCETWAALGGIGKLVEQVPPGSEVIVARDADPEGSKADKGLWRAVEALVARGCRVRLACPPYNPVWRRPDQEKVDFNDVLQHEGEAAIRALIAMAELHGAPAPHYPAVSLPTSQATALLERTVRDWVAHALAHAEGDVARQTGAKAAAGVGKSSALRRALEADARAAEKHIDILVPQHRLADDVARDLAGGPLRVRVIKGRSQKQPDGSTMCAKAEEAEKVARAGFNVWEAMCRRINPETGDEEVCEHFHGCPYVAQFSDSEPAVRIMAHESMFLPRNSEMPKPQAVIIDETFHAKAARQAHFALDRLSNGLPWSFGNKVAMADQDRRNSIAETVRRVLLAGEHPRDHGVTAEDCRFVAKLEIGVRDGIGISPGMAHAAQRKRLELYRSTEAAKLYRFWRILEAEIAGDGPLRQIELRRNVMRKGDDEPRDRVYLDWRLELELPDVPVLVLDADLDPTIGRKFLPRLEVVDVPVERCAEVIQVQDTACSRRKLLGWDGAPDTELSRAANRVAELQALLDVEAANGARVLVVTYKAVAERLKVPAGCAVDWFGNILGVDDYKHFDTVIIAGRQEIGPDAVESMARALFADDPEPLKLTGELVEEERRYRMRDGSDHTAKVRVHPDPRVQALLEQIRERQNGQAIDRLRLIHRHTPARVIVLSNVVLDLTVNRLTTWKEIMPTRFEQAAARGPAVPLSASELARCFGGIDGLWLTAKAAEHDLLNTPKPYKEVICRVSGYLNARYRRAGQRGRSTPALIRADAPDPRAALESVVGPVVWFEVETPAELVAETRLEAAAVAVPVVELGAPVLTVVPYKPPPADELARVHAILAQGSRLADLSSRLDRFKPVVPILVPRVVGQ